MDSPSSRTQAFALKIELNQNLIPKNTYRILINDSYLP